VFQAALLNRFLLSLISALLLLSRASWAQQQSQLDASPTLFTVMAALNMCGYDTDLDSPTNSPLRKAVRAELAKREIPSLSAIKDFVTEHRKSNPTDEFGQYVSFALSVDAAPAFSIKHGPEVPPEVLKMREFSKLMAAFYKEAGIADLWKAAQPGIDALIRPYHAGVVNAVLQSNAYLRQQTSGFKGFTFQIYLEPLAAPGQMQTRSYGNDYTVVISPWPEPRIEEIRRAYLFYLLDPLATRNKDVLERKKVIADHAQRAQLLGQAYKDDFLLLATGSLVRAVEAHMDNKKDDVQKALHEGYILAPYFDEALTKFEKQEQSMTLYYTSMVQSIDLLKEDQRLLPVIFNSQPVATPPPAAPVETKPVTPPIAETLANAEKALKDQNYEQAEKLFQEASNQMTDKHAQAAGLFGLGRIALAQGEAEDAETLFAHTLESESDGQVRALALIYLGRLRLEVNDREQAAKYFQEAIHVEGASDTAVRDARLGLEKSIGK
jgi:tetratricopeptide (TPR) repeat protein